jgi:acyl carrier protein
LDCISNLDVHTIEDFLRDALAEILKDEPENLDFRKPFEEIGFNSLLAIELSNKINSVFGLSLPSTIIYAHPSPGVLLEFLIDEIIPKEETADEDELLELQRLLDEKLKSGKG